MKRIGLASLQAFERTVREGSQKAAAEALGVTPAAVSHAIRTLEARYAVALLEPDGRGVRATLAGTQLAMRLRGAFEAIDESLADLAAEEIIPTVSVTPGFAALWLAPRLAHASGRGAELAMRIDARTACADPDQPGGPDFAVRYARTCDGERLISESFMAYESALASGAETPTTLIETRWRSGSARAPGWVDWCAAASEPLPPDARLIQFDDEHLAVQSALAGAGRVLVSTVLASNLESLGLLKAWRPEIRLPGQSYWLVEPKKRRLSGPARKARQALLDWMKGAA